MNVNENDCIKALHEYNNGTYTDKDMREYIQAVLIDHEFKNTTLFNRYYEQFNNISSDNDDNIRKAVKSIYELFNVGEDTFKQYSILYDLFYEVEHSGKIKDILIPDYITDEQEALLLTTKEPIPLKELIKDTGKTEQEVIYQYNQYIHEILYTKKQREAIQENKNKYNNNPLYAVQEDNYKIFIEPNVNSYSYALDTSTQRKYRPCYVKEIRNLMNDALTCYKSDNNYYYIPTGNGLVEVDPEQQYTTIQEFHSELEEVIQKIIPVSTLTIEPVRGNIHSNDNIIEFLDGTYNIKTGEKIRGITKETIPVSKIEVNYNFKPSSNDIALTKTILKHKFVKPTEVIKHLSDIMFNDTDTKLKQFTIVYGESESGKTSFKDNELKKLFGSEEVDIANFTNEKERTALTGCCKIVVCDEIQNNVIGSSFLNKYTGSKYTTVTEKYNKTGGITIKTKHPIFFGETTLNLRNQSPGTYNRMFLLETHNILYELPEEKLNYMNSQNYIDTLFYLMKEAYNEDNKIYSQNITPQQYSTLDKSLTTVLKKLIHDDPVAPEMVTTDRKNTILALYNDIFYLDAPYEKYLTCLDYHAVKILLKQAQYEGLYNSAVPIDKDITIPKIKEALENFIDDFNTENKFTEYPKKYHGKTKHLRIQIQPNKKGYLMLKRAYNNDKLFKHEDNKVLDYCTLYNPDPEKY